jgi:glycosyltransferase involved in cell wall biosynthesis
VGIVKRYTILHTIETGGPGGAETVMLELASGLDPKRFRSLALLPGGPWLPAQLKSRDIPYVIAESRVWYDFKLLRALLRIVRQEKVDLIHSHLPGQNFYSCVTAKLTGRKIIATYHSALRPSGRDGFRSTIKSWTVRNTATAIVVVSDYLRRAFELERFPRDKVFLIYNGIDLSRFRQSCGGKLRAELGWQGEMKLVGMVANFRRSKGYEYFVRAARQVADKIPDAAFVAVGDIDDTLRGRMRELLHKLDLESRFHFMGFRSDIPQVLHDLDVFVLSSTDEGLSIATIEAMAAGRPVVVTRSGGPQEIVQDGKTGFLVPPADPETLAARVCEILLHPELGARLGAAAGKDVEERFALSRMVGEYEALYQRCLEGS